MDQGFADLIEGLRAAGLYDDTLIVLTSDHGEEFREHGRVGWHSHSLYDELIRVPLVIWSPGVHGGRFEEPVSLIDVFPTVQEVTVLDSPVVIPAW